jgi:hypothetical protein
MNLLRPALLAVMLSTSTLAVAGGPLMPRSELREDRQELRIDRGVVRGAISPHEALRLDRGQARVDHLQSAVRTDGFVGPRERHAVQRLQDRQHRRIRRAVAY